MGQLKAFQEAIRANSSDGGICLSLMWADVWKWSSSVSFEDMIRLKGALRAVCAEGRGIME